MANVMVKDKELLKKAGLDLKGIVKIEAFRSGPIKKVFNRTTGELEPSITGIRENDHKDDVVHFYAMNNPRGGIAGDWRNGLTKEEREYLSTMYNLPIFTIKRHKDDPETTHMLIVRNLEFDLSIPSEASLFKLLSTSMEISSSREMCAQEGTGFYWSTKESRILVKKKARAEKLKAFNLIANTSTEKKIDIIKLMIIDGAFDTDGEEYSIDDHVVAFDEMCLDNGKTMITYCENKLYKEMLMIKSLKKSRVVFEKNDLFYARNPKTGTEIEMGATVVEAASKIDSIEFNYLKEEYKKLKLSEESENTYRPDTSKGFGELLKSLSSGEEDDELAEQKFDEYLRRVKYSKNIEYVINILKESEASFDLKEFDGKNLKESKSIAVEILNKHFA